MISQINTKNISLNSKHIIIIFLVIIFYNTNYYEDNNGINLNINEIIQHEKFPSFKIAFGCARKFIDSILKKKLINRRDFKVSSTPKISAVIPCHNCINYIEYAILSIKNQDYSDFEIVIGDDFSNENTSIFLRQLQKNDSRIKIIKNNKNMGTLYTRTVSSLFSKGKYIFPIDSDDMFLNFNVFSKVIKIAENGNFDILIFNSIVSNLKPNVYSAKIYTHPYERFHQPNLVLIQPELGNFPISPNYRFYKRHNEVLIFAKCIKSKIYKKAFEKLGIERYSRYMVLGEDDIANYVIFNAANIAKFIPYYGYFHLLRDGSISTHKQNALERLRKELYILDCIIESSKL